MTVTIRYKVRTRQTLHHAQPSTDHRLSQGNFRFQSLHRCVTDRCPFKIFWTVQVLFSFSITFVKMSILCFYRRIFTSRRMFIILILTGCFNMAWFLAQFLSVMLSCRPLAFFWNKAIPNGRCIDENAVSYGITAASLVMDIIVFCIPIPSLWKIQRSLSQKLGLIGLFATSSL